MLIATKIQKNNPVSKMQNPDPTNQPTGRQVTEVRGLQLPALNLSIYSFAYAVQGNSYLKYFLHPKMSLFPLLRF
jgi:hypothetical protein